MTLDHRRQVLYAQPCISLQRPGSVKLRLSTVGKGRRQAPCPDADRYGVTHAGAQGGPQSEVGAWGREPNWGEACVRPLGGAPHDVGVAVARKERQRLLATVVEQVPPS